MNASQLQDQLVSALIRKAGGTKRQWRLALGPVRLYDLATHPVCNWSVSPSGSVEENEAIERLLDDFRLDHPLIVAG